MKGRVTNPATDLRCKLSWPAVYVIRRMRGRYLQRIIGAAFDVSQPTISRVQLKRTWK